MYAYIIFFVFLQLYITFIHLNLAQKNFITFYRTFLCSCQPYSLLSSDYLHSSCHLNSLPSPQVLFHCLITCNLASTPLVQLNAGTLFHFHIPQLIEMYKIVLTIIHFLFSKLCSLPLTDSFPCFSVVSSFTIRSLSY